MTQLPHAGEPLGGFSATAVLLFGRQIGDRCHGGDFACSTQYEHGPEYERLSVYLAYIKLIADTSRVKAAVYPLHMFFLTICLAQFHTFLSEKLEYTCRM